MQTKSYIVARVQVYKYKERQQEQKHEESYIATAGDSLQLDYAFFLILLPELLGVSNKAATDFRA